MALNIVSRVLEKPMEIILQQDVCSKCQTLNNSTGRFDFAEREVLLNASDCWLCRVLLQAFTLYSSDFGQVLAQGYVKEIRGEGDPSFSQIVIGKESAGKGIEAPLALGILFASPEIHPEDLVALASPPRGITTCSNQSFRFASQQLRNCLENHNCAYSETVTSPSGPTIALPKRLISLQGVVKLVEDVRPEWQYAALSYCWGLSTISLKDRENGESLTAEESRKEVLDRFHLTTEASLASQMSHIRVNLLPRTIRDAIIITKRLGIHYLWVDSLCIVQDSALDWQAEAPRMGDIFFHAQITIAIDRGSTMDSGCFNTMRRVEAIDLDGPLLEMSEPARDRPKKVYFKPYGVHEVHEMLDNRKLEWKKNMNVNPSAITEMDRLLQSKLEKRAWCFQERLLSPRILHYTESELFWECCDTENGEGFRADSPKYDSHWIRHHITLLKARRLDFGFSETHTSIILKWCYHILEDYCGRDLSFEADRLPAISSVASVFNSKIVAQYIAGIFSTELHIGLAWAAKTIGPRLNFLEENSMPSFSWISRAVSKIHWYRFRFRKEDTITTCEYVSAGLLLRSEDPYGAVLRATLEVSGRMLDSVTIHIDPLASLQKWPGNIPATGALFFHNWENERLKLGYVWHDEQPRSHTYEASFFELYSEMDSSGTIRGVGLVLLKSPWERRFQRIGIATLTIDERDFAFERRTIELA